MNLRVLHVIPSVSPKRGGPSEVIFPMLRALQERGVRAEIATTDDGGDVSPDEPVSGHGVPLRIFSRSSPPLRVLREYAYARTFRPWLGRHLADYDLLHVHALFSHLPSAAMAIAGRRGTPYLNRPLGQLGVWPLRQSRFRKAVYYRVWERGHLRRAAALHFTSESERAEAERLGLPTRGAVIPHGIELPEIIPDAKLRLRARYGLPAARKIVLFLGRLHPKKGLDLLLPALGAAGAPDCTLLLAGEGEPAHEREIGELIRQSGLDSRVIRAGFVSGAEKQLFLQGADVFALPSRHENFGVAVLEALAAGTPVLVSDQVALAGMVAKYRLGAVVPLAVEAVRRGLGDLLTASARACPEEARAFVAAHYSWKTTASGLVELYASILDRPR